MALIHHVSPSAPGRINQERDSTITGGFLWNEVMFDSDRTAIANVASRVLRILSQKALGLTPNNPLWRTQNNQQYQFTADEFLQFAIAMDVFGEEAYVASWTKKAAL